MNDYDVPSLLDECRFNPRHCMFKIWHLAAIDKANSVTFPSLRELHFSLLCQL
jgi:hypothetical protein